jgi:hypothetical protein
MYGGSSNQAKFYDGSLCLDGDNLPTDDEAYILIDQSAVLAVSLEEVGNHIRLTFPCDSSQEAYYNGLINSVTRFVEQYTWRDIQRKTWEYYPETLRYILPLRKSPMRSVDKVEVFSGGAFVLVDAADYSLKKSNIYQSLVFNDDFDCPDIDDVPQPYKITFQTGYLDDDPTLLNQDLKYALLQIIASLNQYRGDCIGPASTSCYCDLSQVPPQALAVLNQYKIIEI